MAVTKTTDMTNLVVTQYKKEYLKYSVAHEGPHLQFVKWLDPIPARGGWGGTLDWPVMGGRHPKVTELTEGEDITPGTLKDYNVTLTAAEYGDMVSHSNLLEFKARADVRSQIAEIMADARRQSINMLVRDKIDGKGTSYPTQNFHIDGSATLVSLGSADTITWEFMTQLAAQARQRGIQPVDSSGNFATIVPPLLVADIRNTTLFKDAATYSGDVKKLDQEIGLYGGFRLIESPEAKIFWGAGAAGAAGTSQTLNAAYNKGDTKIVLNAIGAAAAGQYLTIGTKETYTTSPGSNLEQVYVLNVNPDGDNANEITILGAGDGTNTGLAYDHASGEAVTQTYNVCSIPVIGKNSLIGVFGANTGKYGEAKFKDGLDLLDRIFYTGWYWYGGVSRVEKAFMRGMVALSQGTVGCD